jgi:hypothetical protein
VAWHEVIFHLLLVFVSRKGTKAQRVLTKKIIILVALRLGVRLSKTRYLIFVSRKGAKTQRIFHQSDIILASGIINKTVTYFSNQKI